MSKAMSAKPGDVLTKIAIRVVFDPYFERVIIGSHLERLPRENRQAPITFRVKEALPPPEMYRELRNQRFTTTLEDLVSAAQGEVESLGGELRDWHGNLPEGINSSDKASEIDDAASALENINFPEVPEALGQIKVMHLPALEQDSRPKRSAEVVSMLDDAIDSLNSKADDLRQAIEDAKKAEGEAAEEGEALGNGPAALAPEAASAGQNKEEESDPQEVVDEIESLVSELENVKGELENVTYPSMM
jgi:chromosome segregation ATPase